MKTFIGNELKAHLSPERLFDQIDALEGEVFRAVEQRRTLRTRIGDEYFFAKIHYGVGWREIFKNLLQFRLPVLGAQNEWRAITALEMAGVPTMQTSAFVQLGHNPAAQKSAIVTRALEQTTSLEDYTPTSPRIKRRLIETVATMSRDMHGAGLNHRDFYLCHFLMRDGSEASPALHLIDLHRAQIRARVPERWLVKDLGGLLFSAFEKKLTQRDLLRFVQIYSGRSLRETLTQDRTFWRKVIGRAERLYLQDHDVLTAEIKSLLAN